MFFAALIALLSTLGGAALTYLWETRATLGARLAMGAVLGSVLLGDAGYLLASVFGLNTATLLGATLVSATPLLLLRRPTIRPAFRADVTTALRFPRRWSRRRIGYLFTLTVLGGLFVGLFRGTFYEQDGAYWTNNHNNFGDLAFHLGIIQGFAVGNAYPPPHPEYAGIRLTYPFLIDFLVAQYAAAGASLTGAVLLQNLLLSLSLLVLLLRAGVLFTRRVGAATLTAFFFVFSGGLGFVYAWQDWKQSGQSLSAFLANLPHDYSIWAEKGFRWTNTMCALLTTQRGLLLAIPLALMVWMLWWQTLQHRRTDPVPYRRLLAVGFLLGLVPLVHGHTFLMLWLVGIPLGLRDVWRAPRRFWPWAASFVLSLLIAAPQALLLASSSGAHGQKFFGWQPGWDKGDHNAFAFWWQNLGAFWPLLLAALVWRTGRPSAPVPPRLLRFYAPFLLCFIVPNLLRLAPWVWDNIKVLLYWHLASLWLVSALLALWWRRRGREKVGYVLRRVVVCGLCTSLLLTGSLDVLRIARGEARYSSLFDRDAVVFAKVVRQNTRPGDVVLTAPAFNSPVLLAGRPEVMGFEGHLWSHGLDYAERKADVQAMLRGDVNTPALLAKYGVRYVVIGPLEHSQPDYPLNDAYWQAYPVAAVSGPYVLYRVPSPASPKK